MRIELARRDGEIVLAIADTGAGLGGGADGTGLSIVRALVRDELQGQLRAVERRRHRAPRSSFPASITRRMRVGWRAAPSAVAA